MENTNRFLDYLSTTNTSTSQRCAVVLAPPSLELGKICYSRAFFREPVSFDQGKTGFIVELVIIDK
jgi:hypothetical protein